MKILLLVVISSVIPVFVIFLALALFKAKLPDADTQQSMPAYRNCLPTGEKRFKQWNQTMLSGKVVIIIPMQQSEIKIKCDDGEYWRFE